MILDESHRIKSPSARKSTLVHSLGPEVEYRLILTGTVVTKKKRLVDIWSQWKFLNPDRFNMTHGEFKYIYGRFRQMGNYEKWLRNINEDKLHRLIHFDAFSITREECYDLPAQTHQIIPVELEDEQSGAVYDQMAEEMVAKIKTGEITEASIALVLSTRLRQITSGLSKTSPSAKYPKARTQPPAAASATRLIGHEGAEAAFEGAEIDGVLGDDGFGFGGDELVPAGLVPEVAEGDAGGVGGATGACDVVVEGGPGSFGEGGGGGEEGEEEGGLESQGCSCGRTVRVYIVER